MDDDDKGDDKSPLTYGALELFLMTTVIFIIVFTMIALYPS